MTPAERHKKDAETRPVSTITWHSTVNHHLAQDSPAVLLTADPASMCVKMPAPPDRVLVPLWAAPPY